MLTLNAEIESCELTGGDPDDFWASIHGNEKLKLVAQGKTPEEALRQVLISLQVHLAYNLGFEIKEPPIPNFDRIELHEGKAIKEITILF